MNIIQIPIYVDQKVAAAEGRLQYGDNVVTPTEAQWATLSPEERLWLVGGEFQDHLEKCNRETRLPLLTGEVSWEAVVAAMRPRFSAITEARAQQKAEAEAKAATLDAYVATLLQRPLDEWFQQSADREWSLHYGSWDSRPNDVCVEDVMRHSKVLAFTGPGTPVDQELDRRREQVREERLRARQIAENAERQREEEKAKAEDAARQSFNAYAAARGGVLERGVRAGYDMTGAVVDDVVRQIADALRRCGVAEEVVVLRDGTRKYKVAGWKKRISPDSCALDTWDRVSEVLERDVANPDALEVVLLDLMRFNSDPSGDCSECGCDRGGDEERQRYTAVIVSITSPITKDAYVVIRAEQ